MSLFSETEAPPQLIIALVEDIEEQKQAEMALKSSEEKLRILSARLIDSQEKERKLITRELHDSIGASLSAIKFALESRLDQNDNRCDNSKGISLKQIIAMVKETIEETQRISTSLRPSILDDMGILKTIGWICRKFNEIYSDIHIEQTIEIQEEEVPEPLKIVICRIVQEALNNIAKHAQAERVIVSIRNISEVLELRVEDNGQGFDMVRMLSEEMSTTGMGLSGMKDRIELSGGMFDITSEKGKGTTIHAVWSVSRDS
jgi:signal transduction histidine kinase